MRVLIVGGGGREHALAWKIGESKRVDELFAMPGNGGISDIAKCLDPVFDPKGIADIAVDNKIDFTVIGPEAPLVAGVVDEFQRRGLSVFGPNRSGARMEGSKAFAKEIMAKYNVPTGVSHLFSDYEAAKDHLKSSTFPIVVKADGLAGGKGVIIAKDLAEATVAITSCLVDLKFKEAGATVLIEEFLEGEEVSLLAFCDGTRALPLVPAQDYKRIYEDDLGPNTGGMGSYSPIPSVTEDIYEEIVKTVLDPTIEGLKKEGIEYRGMLYAGVILTDDGPKALEFNARFGDPETQAILPMMESDLLEVMIASSEGDLSGSTIKWSDKRCVSVVLASEGYPESPLTGREVTGLGNAAKIEGVQIFHAGTKKVDGKIITTGGRVFCVSAVGENFKQARERAYRASELIRFEGKQLRTDIAKRAEEVMV